MSDGKVRLRVICGTVPEQTFGLQNKQEQLTPGESMPDGRVAFHLELAAKKGDDHPVFTGPHAHGPPKERFLYLTTKNNLGRIVKRIKVPLKSINWNQIEEVLSAPDSFLSVEVEGDRTGTVPLLGEGWTVER